MQPSTAVRALSDSDDIAVQTAVNVISAANAFASGQYGGKEDESGEAETARLLRE